MERVSFVYLYLLSVGGILMVVTAEASVSAWIVTPEADRKEGGQVHMRCVATNLESDHVVEWRIKEPVQTLRWGSHSVTNNRRFLFETTQTGDGHTTQDFTITDLQRDDTNEYVCNVLDLLVSGGSTIVATASVQLSVLYFPNESFPICSPEGPITVDAGTQLNMRCLSASGNPTVTIEVSHSPTNDNDYTWAMSVDDIIVLRTLDVTVDAAINRITFICNVSSISFSGMSRSCNIGPVSITGMTETVTTGRITETPSPSVTSIPEERTLHPVGFQSTPRSNVREPTGSIPEPHDEPITVTTRLSTLGLQTASHPNASGVTGPNPGFPRPVTVTTELRTLGLQTIPSSIEQLPSSIPTSAFVIVTILLAASIITIVFLINRVIRLKHLNKNLLEKETHIPEADAYMELQPTGDINGEYMEPARKETTTEQHTYYQAVEENKSPEYEYAKPEDCNNTKSKISESLNTDKQYQNVD